MGVGGRWSGVGVGAYSRLGAYSNKYGTQITVALLYIQNCKLTVTSEDVVYVETYETLSQ